MHCKRLFMYIADNFVHKTPVIDAYIGIKWYRDEYHDTRPAYDSKACKNSIQMDEGYRVVGVVEDELYILLNDLGQTGYVPQEWLFEGNG